MKRILSAILSASLLTTSSCIHVPSSETEKLQLHESDKAVGSPQVLNELEVRSQIVSPNTHSKLLKELMSQGLTPVYVKVHNNSSEPIRIEEKDFILVRGATLEMEPIANEGLPRAVHRFNPVAVAANVHNVTVTVLGIFVIAAAIVAVPANGSPDLRFYPTGHENMTVINSTTKTIYLSYQDGLLTSQVIAPGQSVEGLLFFENLKRVPTNEWSLSLRPNPNN